MKFTNMTKEQFDAAVSEKLQMMMQKKGAVRKYNHQGIYCITVDGKIVYVGKSRNMMKRIAQHMVEIENNTEKNMYNVLRQLHENHSIGFDVVDDFIKHIYTDRLQANDDNLGMLEAKWIRHYCPCLNVQYPKIENYHSFDYCRRAKTITAKEVEEILDNYK